MRHPFRSLAIVVAVVCTLTALSGCDEAEPAGPSNVGGVPVVESFVGTVTVGGSAFYSFTVPTQGTVSLTLLSLTENGQPSSAVLGLNIGTPVGITCSGSPSVATAPGATPQLVQTLGNGVFCAKVSDTGQITSTASFALNIARPR